MQYKNEKDISPLVSDFERIKQVAGDGRVFWSARDFCSAMGYSTYQKFERILVKAMAAVKAKGLVETDHFNQSVEMVRLGSGSFCKVENYHLAQIYESGELHESATIRKIGIVQNKGGREVNRSQMLYNLDAIRNAVLTTIQNQRLR